MNNIQVSEQLKRVTILTLRDRLDAFNASTAREQVDQLLQGGATHFAVDLSEITFMDSAGIAVLVNLLKRTRQIGGGVKLVRSTNPAALRLLQLTKFDQIFEMFDTAEEAVKAF